VGKEAKVSEKEVLRDIGRFCGIISRVLLNLQLDVWLVGVV
jgi:hypothetical protein